MECRVSLCLFFSMCHEKETFLGKLKDSGVFIALPGGNTPAKTPTGPLSIFIVKLTLYIIPQKGLFSLKNGAEKWSEVIFRCSQRIEVVKAC